MTTCEFFCQQLSDYIDGELREFECELMENHLEVCPPCNLLFQTLKTTVEICHLGISDEIPEDVRIRLRQFLRQHCRGYACEPQV